MIPAAFDYVAPESVADALAALADSEDAKVLAGGQSLLPILRMRLNAPERVVDLGHIPQLQGVHEDGDDIVIGAMTSYADLLAEPLLHLRPGGEHLHDARQRAQPDEPLVAEHADLLRLAVSQVADPQIRRRGTIGGALVHADPAGDIGAPILALNAQLVIAGSGGERTVAASDFFEDLFTTAVGEDELLTAVRIPKHTGWGAAYEKFVRVSHQWSIVAVAATVRMTGETIAEARVGLTNMGATPLRATATEAALAGRAASAAAIADACALAADGTNPPSDLNAGADYRRHLAQILTRRAVLAAAGRAG